MNSNFKNLKESLFWKFNDINVFCRETKTIDITNENFAVDCYWYIFEMSNINLFDNLTEMKKWFSFEVRVRNSS